MIIPADAGIQPPRKTRLTAGFSLRGRKFRRAQPAMRFAIT
jgi:hypothetical protein